CARWGSSGPLDYW
nr:immunoglobulin heavy chain junction region [Mus musculus]